MKKNNNINSVLYLLIITTLLIASPAFAHEGHDDVPGEHENSQTFGPISISAEAKENLKIETYAVAVVALQETLSAFGQIEPIPSRSSAISSRISGRVSTLFVNDGQRVKKGEALIEVESRQVGDPPPRVLYRAPLDGIVVDRHVVLGDTVEPEKHLLEVVDLSEVYAEGRIFEGQISAIQTGQNARVKVESFPERSIEGRVELISGALDPISRTMRIWVLLKNPDLRLRPNMRATVHVAVREANSALAVPHRAILGEAGNKFVFVESDSDALTYERRLVITGLRDDRYTEIIQGVFPGDKVVIEGGYQLQYITPKPITKD